MKKRAKLCFYIFIALSFIALGLLGFHLFQKSGDNVMAGAKKFVTFNSVRNATSYSVEVAEGRSAQYSVYKSEAEGNNNCYNFEVEVYVDNIKIAEENYTQEIVKKYSATNKIDCKIKDYTIIFFDGEQNILSDKTVKYEDQMLKEVDKDVFCIAVSEYFEDVFVLDGTYSITCTPFNNDEEIKASDGKSLALTKDFDYKAYYKQEFLRRGEYYYNGEWYDYVIDDKEELKAFVWRTILYRGAQEGETFYVNTTEITSANVNSLVFEAVDTYPEYNALNNNTTWASMKGKVGTLTKFSYFLPENFTKTSSSLDMSKLTDAQRREVEQNRYKIYDGFDVEYVSKEPSERHFAIDKTRENTTQSEEDKKHNQSGQYEADEVVVYNTEQLFMVVQSGGRPVFVDGKSDISKAVYNEALNVLQKINNSDSLSDYEKTLNIYNYLTGEIVYDGVIYNYMEQVGSFLVSDFGEYSCFYLEGVFYDFGETTHYAVCDGLSKAYSLMCNIEGIECIKVNGEVESGAHAWNRVYLTSDEGRNLQEGYYYVDCTWGEGRCTKANESNKEEIYQLLTHSHFLFKQNDNERTISYPTIVEDNSLQYDYYKNTTIDCTIDDKVEKVDYYVESDTDLEKLILATYQGSLSTKKKYVEVKFSPTYLSIFSFNTFVEYKINQICTKLINSEKISPNYQYFTNSSYNLLFFMYGN